MWFSDTARKIFMWYTGMGAQILAPKKEIYLNLYKYFNDRLCFFILNLSKAFFKQKKQNLSIVNHPKAQKCVGFGWFYRIDDYQHFNMELPGALQSSQDNLLCKYRYAQKSLDVSL